jgi:hypothetical protein
MLGKISLVLVMTLAACATTKVIQTRPQQGGIIELQGDRTKARADAEQQMAANCGAGNWHVEKEGEEPIGTDTVQSQSTTDQEHTSKNGRTTTDEQTTTNVTSTRTVTAFRIHYACGPAGTPVAAPPPAEPAAPQPDPNAPPPPTGGGY